jgi:TM2 domain-containing membrane protein YozV
MMGQTPIQVNNYVGAPGYQMPYMPLKSKAVAAILAFFFGAFGVHRFYLGHNGTGAAMLIITIVTCGWGGIAMGIWALVDFVLILTGGLNDAQGRALTA